MKKTMCRKNILILFIALLISFVFLGGCQPSSAVDPTDGSVIRQTTCPVMVNTPIDTQVSTVYRGNKVYFCCKGCIARFKANPEKYLDKLPQFNEQGTDGEK